MPLPAALDSLTVNGETYKFAIMNQTFIYLASASPRRRQLLRQLGINHRVRPVDIDESHRPGETARDLVVRLAREKAQAAVDSLGRDTPVLAADTVVVVDAEILGKPSDGDDALGMLQRLSGRSHQVLTAVAVVDATAERDTVNTTEVVFRAMTEAESRSYVATGEPLDKAGAYAIQGKGAIFVERVAGSYSGVMGLPLFETALLLRQSGIDVLGGEV